MTPLQQRHIRPWVWIITIIMAPILLGASCTFDRLKHLNTAYYFVGRIALSQDADPNVAGSKADSWSAHFELAGNPNEGNLLLYTPVGTVVAQVTWGPNFAKVESSEENMTFTSLDELTNTYFQQSIPVAALFDWLRGEPTEQNVPGWSVDLGRIGHSTIKAERSDPSPHVRLRAVVDEFEDRTPSAQEQS